MEIQIESAAGQVRAECESALERFQVWWPPDDQSADDRDECQDKAGAPADELRDVGVIDEEKAMQLLDATEKSAPLMLLTEHAAGTGIYINALFVRKADRRRAVATFQDFDAGHRGVAMKLARSGDQIVERQACAARTDVPKATLDHGFELRAEHHRKARDREEDRDETEREPGPAMNLENGLAKGEVQDGSSAIGRLYSRTLDAD